MAALLSFLFGKLKIVLTLTFTELATNSLTESFTSLFIFFLKYCSLGYNFVLTNKIYKDLNQLLPFF